MLSAFSSADTLVALITNNMKPDQTAPKVCFHGENILECIPINVADAH